MLNLQSHQTISPPPSTRPVLTVVVDTEEEFDWSQPFDRRNVGVSSIAAQPLAHERVFDKHGVVPTYVIDWPVATTPSSIAVLKKLMDEGRCEIGTHLHPWVSPPHTEEVNNFNSYAGNLPRELEFEKLRLLTEAITTNFGRAPKVFKAGRYGVGPHTAEIIAKLGYMVDASVVPYSDMSTDGGPDFSAHGHAPYWFEANGCRLMEQPATATYAGLLHTQGHWLHNMLLSSPIKGLRLPGITSRLGILERVKITPEGCSLEELKRATRCLVNSGGRFVGLTYHSPSMHPGHTPYVRTQRDLDRFLDTLDGYIHFFKEEMNGVVMSSEQYWASQNHPKQNHRHTATPQSHKY